jgi:DNA-binding transcriptional regulator YiaG
MKSSLKERFGHRVRIRDVSPKGSGSSVAYVLEAHPEAFSKTVTAAQVLIRNGVGASKARTTVERLLAGEKVPLVVPQVGSTATFERELDTLGVRAHRRAIPAHVDVAAIRQRLHLTQEEFAARFALSVATVRNWEQNRSVPDDASRAFLAVIARAPEVAEEAVSV